jgi:hypothetical protein
VSVYWDVVLKPTALAGGNADGDPGLLVVTEGTWTESLGNSNCFAATVASFQRDLIQKNGPVYYAINNNHVVGWCDIFPEENPRQSPRDGRSRGVDNRLAKPNRKLLGQPHYSIFKT